MNKTLSLKYKISDKYYEIKAWFSVVFLVRIRCFFYFMRLAFLMLIGKLLFMDTYTRTIPSNGGHKYLDLVISKRPLSKEHTYEEF